MKNTYSIKKSNISISIEANIFIKNCCQIMLCEKYSRKKAAPKVMSVALIESFDRWFLSLSKGSGTLVEMTAPLNMVVSINSTTVMQTYWTAFLRGVFFTKHNLTAVFYENICFNRYRYI